MTNQFFSNPAALARLLAGPLGPHMDPFASLLSKRGFTRRLQRYPEMTLVYSVKQTHPRPG